MCMYDALLQSIAAKYGGEFAPDSLVWSMAAGDIVDYELTIPTNWVGYLLEVSGYTTGGDINVIFYDQDNIPRWEWTEFIDTQKDFPVLPFLEKFYTGTIKFRFTNKGTATQDIGFATTMLLIPEENRIEFEKEMKDLSSILPLLRKIAGET